MSFVFIPFLRSGLFDSLIISFEALLALSFFPSSLSWLSVSMLWVFLDSLLQSFWISFYLPSSHFWQFSSFRSSTIWFFVSTFVWLIICFDYFWVLGVSWNLSSSSSVSSLLGFLAFSELYLTHRSPSSLSGSSVFLEFHLAHFCFELLWLLAFLQFL